MAEQIEDRINEFTEHVERYFLLNQYNMQFRGTVPGDTSPQAHTKFIDASKKRSMDMTEAGDQIRSKGRELAKHLETLGVDSSTLLKAVVCVDRYAGGYDAMIKLWPDVKAWLLRITMQGNARQPEGTAKKTNVPAHEPLSHSGEEATDDHLPATVKNAYLAFELAEQKAGKTLTDAEAHEFIRDDHLGLFDQYVLPNNVETWARSLRRAREHHGTQKNKPRGGRTGHSTTSARDGDISRDA